jgi:N12 class adenine-specific DNA methylase
MPYSKEQHLKDNTRALEVVSILEKEGRTATTAEREQLRKYSGFGGLSFILHDPAKPDAWPKSERNLIPPTRELFSVIRSISRDEGDYRRNVDSLKSSVLSSFYTPVEIIQAITDALNESTDKPGGFFQNKKILEPSAGTGLFIEPFACKNSEITAIEKDLLTGRILQALYPSIHGIFVKVEPFEETGLFYKDYFDVAISNIPFGNFYALDPNFLNSKDLIKRDCCRQIHNYFFVKTIELLRHNGLLCFITSSAFLDTPGNKPFREYLMKTADLISAIRLPSNLFKESANTEVSTDLVIVRKNQYKSGITKEEANFIKSVQIEDCHINGLYKNSFQNIIHTSYVKGKNQYGEPAFEFTHSGTTADTGSQLFEKLKPVLKQHFSRRLSIPVPSGQPQITWPDLFSPPVTQIPKIKIPSSVPFHGKFKDFYREKTYVIYENQPGQLINFLKSSGQSGADFQPFTDLTKEQEEIIKSYIQIRDYFIELYGNEQTTKTENYDLRTKLNRQTDLFISRFGAFDKSENRHLLKVDSFYPDLSAAVRIVDGQMQKAEIFLRPVAFAPPVQILSETDAMTASLNLFGKIDMTFMSEKTQKQVDEIVRVLDGFIFFNPVAGGWEYKDKLLSGNVISKIENIRKYDNGKNFFVTQTLQALDKVRPDPVPFPLLDFNFGERWIPVQIYENYLSSIFRTSVSVQYSQALDLFTVSGGYNSIVGKEYALDTESKKINGYQLAEFAILNTCPVITKKIMESGKEVTVKDTQAIQLCNAKIEAIRNGFTDWLNQPEQTEIQNRITKLYNETFNCFVKPDYDGSFQTLPGFNSLSLGFKPYKSQLDALWMIKQNGGGIVDHEVGGGKTLIMCMIAYEMQRLNIAHKPLIIGMKANTRDIAQTFKRAYPSAKILYPSANDFNMKNRVKFFSELKNNNWDCIIMTHDQFAKIPQDLQTQHDIIAKELDDVELNLRTLEKLTGTPASKKMEKGLIVRKLNLKAKLLAVKLKINEKKDDFISFNELGIDHIIIDESQQFKNLTFTTRHSRISGLGNPEGSQRALNLLTAIRCIQNQKDSDLCSTLVSGTPISNSLTELYLIFKYLRPRVLEQLKINNFDAWVSVFAKKTVDFEFSVTNELIQNERFRHFIKVPELSMFYAEIAHVRTSDEIGIQKPEMNEQLISIDITPDQRDFSEKLKEFAKTGDYSLIGKEPPSNKDGKMLVATSLARKMSLDMRLINPSLPDHPNSKVSVCAAKIYEYYKKFDSVKGTQLVFSDLGVFAPSNNDKFSVYQALREKLNQEYQIPLQEIAFIQECKTDHQKETVKTKIMSGEIRVLMGSTSTLGTGNNVQARIVAMHHLDTPWKPSEMRQRNGRGSRKGNIVAEKYNNNKVDTFLYATINTLDNYKISLLHNKNIFIQQIRQQNLSVRSFDEGALDESGGLNYAEYVAILSGNQDLLEKCRIEHQITVLESERHAFMVSKNRTKGSLQSELKLLMQIQSVHQKLTEDWQKFEEAAPSDHKQQRPFELEINGSRSNFFDDILAKEIVKLKETCNTEGKYLRIGSYHGFEVHIRTNTILTGSIETPISYVNKFYVKGNHYYTCNNGDIGSTSASIFSYFPRALEKIPKLLKEHNDRISEKQELIQTCERIIHSTWDKEDQLNRLKNDLRLLETKIKATIQNVSPENTEVKEKTSNHNQSLNQ